jgi:hypothetical protein
MLYHNGRKQRENGKETAISYILRPVVQTYYSAFCFSLFQNLQKASTDEAIILGDFISHNIRENIYYLMKTLRRDNNKQK